MLARADDSGTDRTLSEDGLTRHDGALSMLVLRISFWGWSPPKIHL